MRATTRTVLLLAVFLGGPLVMPAVSSTSLASAAPTPAAPGAGPLLPGTSCPIFPADDVWNTPVTGLPVDRHSAAWLAHMAAGSTFLHPDYGPGGGASPYGIPWEITPAAPEVRTIFTSSTATKATAVHTRSRRGPRSRAGGLDGRSPRADGRPGDLRACTSSMTPTTAPAGRSTAGSGAIWNLRSNRLRPAGWTSADAAGLPILPGLVNYDEVTSGHIDHAIRFTAQTTSTRYIWPARHEAGATANPAYPPMGARFRLKPGFNLPASRCFRACQVVIQAMKTYGLILADNGSNWFFQGATDRRWTYTMVDQLKAIPASAFEAIDESCLMISPNSGQARQPGTAAYRRACR